MSRLSSNDVEANQPAKVLAEIKATRSSSVFLLSDCRPYVDDPMHVCLLRDSAVGQAEGDHTVIFPFSHGPHPDGT